MTYKLTYKTFGEKAILIEWDAVIDQEILNDIFKFKENIISSNRDTYADFIIGYNSLTVIYKEIIIDFIKEIEKLKFLYKINISSKKQDYYVWELPVCYDISFGIDLKEISQKLNLSIEEIIQLHSSPLYTVFFIGFLPGFLYLGGLSEQIFLNRKATPRLLVAKGSVGIGGKQTGIYPSNSAGGWNIIGKSPINFFNIKHETPCFAKAGDKIKFISVSLEEYASIEKEVLENQYQFFKTSYHG